MADRRHISVPARPRVIWVDTRNISYHSKLFSEHGMDLVHVTSNEECLEFLRSEENNGTIITAGVITAGMSDHVLRADGSQEYKGVQLMKELQRYRVPIAVYSSSLWKRGKTDELRRRIMRTFPSTIDARDAGQREAIMDEIRAAVSQNIIVDTRHKTALTDILLTFQYRWVISRYSKRQSIIRRDPIPVVRRRLTYRGGGADSFLDRFPIYTDQYFPPGHYDDKFVLFNSEWASWVQFHNPNVEQNGKFSLEEITRKWSETPDRVRRTPNWDGDKRLAQLARRYNCLTGKWMLFMGNDHRAAQTIWSRIMRAAFRGDLPCTGAKISPTGHKYGNMICVYTRNYLDLPDVQKVRRELFDLGFTGPLDYKADIYTILNIKPPEVRKSRIYRQVIDGPLALPFE
eukprot:CAMPEP_0119127426 /NCGR_PEP_ID=MMETSP1310-20130426/5984_1 /TAXON_ID=464262 /ORGANISM="Genus nov. species nov., Strain RCC2339" /LENGTH=401 /DNA_ID=CAMNT_0007117685 /DNA_START=362 /DNA_END=1567 /DNA_ORIENTATION=+